MPKLLLAAVFCTVAAQAQTVEGRVLNSLTGSGIAGARVELVKAAATAGVDPEMVQQTIFFEALTGKTAYSAITDAQGRFRIEDVQEGGYTVRYRAGFYRDESEGAGLAPAIRPFSVTAANPAKLEVRMVPMGRLSGRAVDGRGVVIPHAHLDLLQANGDQGLDADAQGNFDVALDPGLTYTLILHPPVGWKPPDPDPESGRAMAWTRTYYPGVARAEAAGKIVLQPGVHLADVELKLLALPAHALRGVLLNPDGTPASKAGVVLGEKFFRPAMRVNTAADGTFEFPAVVDGLWRLSADVDGRGGDERAVEWVEMAGRDHEGLKLRLQVQFTVRGKVVLETPKGRAAPKPPMVRLTPVTPDDIYEPPVEAWPDGDGNFNLEHVYGGAYRLALLPELSPSGYYLDAVRLGGSDAPAPQMELRSSAVPLTLVFRTNGGAVRGTVENCGAGGVVLVAEDAAARWPGMEAHTLCDPHGRYELTGLRPGAYLALALPATGRTVVWPERFDDGLLQQATRVEVHADETTSADLKPAAEGR